MQRLSFEPELQFKASEPVTAFFLAYLSVPEHWGAGGRPAANLPMNFLNYQSRYLILNMTYKVNLLVKKLAQRDRAVREISRILDKCVRWSAPGNFELLTDGNEIDV